MTEQFKTAGGWTFEHRDGWWWGSGDDRPLRLVEGISPLDVVLLKTISGLREQLATAEMAIRHWAEACGQKVTCLDCGARNTCELVWDPYNTNGDCLAEK